MSAYQYPANPVWPPPAPTSAFPAPVYTILITGMVLFMASNVMPNLLPAPDRIFNVAPRMLMWGFWLILLTLLAQMTGAIPGAPQLHLTYVHMTVAALIFILMWNQLATEITPAPATKSSSSSSSSSREKPKEAKPEKKAEKPPAQISPWDDLRAHPSAFLTTRLNRAAMWPFPMGKAAHVGPELWWESGNPSHVGHFNKPEAPPEAKDEKKRSSSDGDKEKQKEKEKAKLKEQEKEKEKLKEAERAKAAEKEAAERKKRKEEEMKKAMEGKKVKVTADATATKTEKDTSDKQKQKLWRTKALMMITGISLLSKSLGFLLLLFFSLQMISQELNGSPSQTEPIATSSSSAPSSGVSGSATRSPSDPDREAEKAKQLAKMQAAKDAERAKVGSSSSSSDREKEKEKEKEKAKMQAAKDAQNAKASGSGSSSSSRSKESSSSSSRSSSKDSDLVTSDAVREASGTKTKTITEGGGDAPTPFPLGMGMHYIHTRGADGNLDDAGASFIPSDGIPHPLMTSVLRGWAG